MRKLYWALLCCFLGSVGLDQVTKHQVQDHLLVWEDQEDSTLYRGRKIPVFATDDDGLNTSSAFYFGVNWQYSRNKGAAFSMLADLDDRFRVPFFYLITIIAVIAIVIYFRLTPENHYLTRYGLVLILSGAIGNFLDRVQHGYVIDFVDVEWKILGWRHDFAIFNVADVAINIGVIAFFLDMIYQTLKERRSAALTD